ncbi:hypothetical protein GPECTOR_67g304 [Gonium pectorale]|uniref:Uncharacterized protein n=1 Tax=Gonium pectorale TaxID=33097 RepID=A0A150G3R4_GONPE|nr:hypothetical protein GPECTOR_67g304 [Gonium pectorale]|eukprot:KXZ44464.1 hypothetical protein GPECTOR_67g304 [Gonium pectorale]
MWSARSARDQPSAQRPTSGLGSASASTSVDTPAFPPPSSAPSSEVLLESLRVRGISPSTHNVYGKPLSKSELSALDDASVTKRAPLPVVEGAMVVLEMLVASAASASSAEIAAGLDLVAPRRWQLVVGADVGAVQYIPAVEELQVAPDGASFTLGTDLDFIFTGFRGPCKWLAPGHLQYDVRHVRLEFRTPKGWRRAAAWLKWRWAGMPRREPRWGDSLPTSPTCREDPSAPGVLLPLPFFPTNELRAFLCDGRLALTRSRLTGGLILLLEVDTRERLREAA